jgi:UDP-3-O-[3-hydroxymyristoyl] glucosamine N-acyltransferase
MGLILCRNNVSLQHCTIGRDCILHNGVSIGQDGKS